MVALIVGLAALGAFVSFGGHPKRVALPDDLRSRLLFVAEPKTTELIRTDGTVLQHFPQLAAAGYPVQPVVTADHLVVFVHQRQAYRVGPDMRAPAQRVGVADRVFPADGGNVGLQVGGSDSQPGLVGYMAADGTVPEPGTAGDQLPGGSTALARLVGRLLVLSGDGHVRFAPAPLVDLGPVTFVIGASYATVAWTARVGCSAEDACPLHISELAGSDQLISPPAGFDGFVGGGAFSPGGASLAAFVFAGTAEHPAVRLALIDTHTGRTQTIGPALSAGEPIGSAQWSPDGTWLFFSGLRGPMYAQQELRGDPVGSPIALPLPASYAFAPL